MGSAIFIFSYDVDLTWLQSPARACFEADRILPHLIAWLARKMPTQTDGTALRPGDDGDEKVANIIFFSNFSYFFVADDYSTSCVNM